MVKYSDGLICRYLEYMKLRCKVEYTEEEAQLHLESLASLFILFANLDN